MWIGDEPMHGVVWGAVQAGRHSIPLDVLQLVGTGMFRLALTRPQGSVQETLHTQDVPDVDASLPSTAIWSRTIQRLYGLAPWRRWAGKRCGSAWSDCAWQ